MIIDLAGVVADGSEPAGTIEPAQRAVQAISWPEAEDGTIRVKLIKGDLTAEDISGAGVQLWFAIRKHPYDVAPLFLRQFTVTDGEDGEAEVGIVAADTFDEELGTYYYDVQYRDQAGKRWQVVPYSPFELAPIVARPDEAPTPITPPTGTFRTVAQDADVIASGGSVVVPFTRLAGEALSLFLAGFASGSPVDIGTGLDLYGRIRNTGVGSNTYEVVLENNAAFSIAYEFVVKGAT